LGLVVHWVGERVARAWSKARTGHPVQGSLVRNMAAPTRLIVPLLALELGLTAVDIRSHLRSELLHGVGIALVLSLGFAVVRATFVLDDVILARYHLDVENNLKARRVHTQIQVLRRVTVVIVAVVTLAVVLLSFPSVRAAGAGLLASAGIVGIVAGVAARPAATNLVAGLQIAISQPIRVDDVVVVDGNFGRIEEIALTYVVVRVWDLRRLVVPISYFIENSFENWTRSSADILGWVFLEVDYSAPVGAIREQLAEILRSSEEWDGGFWNLQVTDLEGGKMQLRVLVSARDSSRSWDLQCEIRERLIAWLQSEHPTALPRTRAELVESKLEVPIDVIAGRVPRG
jgi:small-conductance mechanosensitive channel